MDKGCSGQHGQPQSDAVDDMPWLSDFITTDALTEDWVNDFPQFPATSTSNNASNNPFDFDFTNLGALDTLGGCDINPDVMPDMAAPLSVLLQQVEQERKLESVQQRKSLPRKRST